MTDLESQKAIGRSHMLANQGEEALRVFAQILRKYPEDIETYLIVGDWYLGEGDGEAATLFYQQASELEPQNDEITRRLRLAEEERSNSPERVAPGKIESPGTEVYEQPSEPEQETQANPQKPRIPEARVKEAAELMYTIINSPTPAETVSENLDKIDLLLPALVELNVRQARADGRHDLAQALEDLLLKLAPSTAITEPSQTGQFHQPQIETVKSTKRILFIGPASGTSLKRQTLPAEALAHYGCEVSVSTKFPAEFEKQFDIVVAHDPHGDQSLMPGLASCAAQDIPLVIDLDMDFEKLPLNHPSYEQFGLSTQSRARSYASAMLFADQIVVPNGAQANALRQNGYACQVVPNGWNAGNALWRRPQPNRRTIHLGWIANPGQIEDIHSIRRIVIRILREYPNTRLVIVGDSNAYQLFSHLPEHRRLFLPAVSLEDQPYLFEQIDILLVPLQNTPFNQQQSDDQLMEAGIRSIPWVASPIPAFNEWGAGGVLAHTQEEWHTSLRQMILDPDLRQSLGEAGREKAFSREMSHLGREWEQLLEQVIQKMQPTQNNRAPFEVEALAMGRE